MKSAREALAPGGAFLVTEYRKSDKLEDSVSTDRRAFYGFGLLECMPTAVAEGGPGYGCGIPEQEMRDSRPRPGSAGATASFPKTRSGCSSCFARRGSPARTPVRRTVVLDGRGGSTYRRKRGSA